MLLLIQKRPGWCEAVVDDDYFLHKPNGWRVQHILTHILCIFFLYLKNRCNSGKQIKETKTGSFMCIKTACKYGKKKTHILFTMTPSTYIYLKSYWHSYKISNTLASNFSQLWKAWYNCHVNKVWLQLTKILYVVY